ncbi:UNVERIFIED_CONTAM: hypothetical protein GTU68_044393, partial [Idotea baltica]|nr:hypothetical protein [Idotea baltica]
RGKLKPLSDVVLAKKEKALGLERCEAVLYPTPQMPPTDGRASRALWAGLKPLEGNHYTVDHCQPMDQKPARLDLIPSSDNNYDYADYSTIGYTTIGPSYGDARDHKDTLSPPLSGRPVHSSSFENVGFVPGEEAVDVTRMRPNGSALSRAAYLLGTKSSQAVKTAPHLYEMVTPRVSATSSRRHKSLEHGSLRQTPVISAPTGVNTMRLPPLNSRYNGRYTLKAYPNGSHTLTLNGDSHSRADRKYAHVSLDRSGAPSTTLAPSSPSDNIYASPITSPVI